MFFGIILLIIGVSLILPKIPIFNILLGAGLIILGLSMFLGTDVKNLFSHEKENMIVFREGEFVLNDKYKEYITLFGNSKLNLDKTVLSDSKKIKVISIFGNSKISLDKNSNYKIKSTTVFGSSNVSENNKSGFGETKITSAAFDENRAYLDLEIASVFGNTEVVYSEKGNNKF